MTTPESASPTGPNVGVEAAWREHSPALLAYAHTVTRDPAEAEDWVAEAFARTMAATSRGRGPTTDIRGYLFAAVRSLRAEAARRPVRVEPVEALPEHHPDLSTPDRSDHVVDAIVAARAYASLPRRWQEVVHMVAVDDARIDEVAKQFDITPNAASVLTRRASEGLRAAYLQQWCPPASEDACELIRPDLVAWVRETLPPARAARVGEHGGDCEDCAAAVALLRGEVRRLGAIPLWLLLPAVPEVASGLAGARVLDGTQPVESLRSQRVVPGTVIGSRVRRSRGPWSASRRPASRFSRSPRVPSVSRHRRAGRLVRLWLHLAWWRTLLPRLATGAPAT